MKVQYEPGDVVYDIRDVFGVTPLTVVSGKQRGAVCEDAKGRRSYYGKRQFRPAANVVANAKWCVFDSCDRPIESEDQSK